MKILSRLCTSLDGCVSTADGWPVQLAFPGWDAGALGYYELQARCDAVVMGRTTFEPALGAPHWPWGELDVFVLGSHRPPGTPERVVVSEDPRGLLHEIRSRNRGGDVHLVGGPSTIATFLGLEALDEFRLMVLPMLSGAGLRLTPDIAVSTGLTLLAEQRWPAGVVELTYGTGAG